MSIKSQADFVIQYRDMPDEQLLLLAREGGLFEEAREALAMVIKERNLKNQDVIPHMRKSPHERQNDAAQEKTFWSGRGRTGLYFYGKRYLNDADKAADIQLRTKWFVLASFPLVPLASYRFKCKQKSFGWFKWNIEERVVNRVQLNWTQICITWLQSIVFVIALIAIIALYEWLKGRR